MFALSIDILIRNGWQSSDMIIEDPARSNIQKCFMMPLPGFDIEQFPFVICSGMQSWSLVNVKLNKLQSLIRSRSMLNMTSDGAFFIVRK